MTEHPVEAVSGRSVLAGLGLATVLGGLAGIMYSAASWPRPTWIEGSGAIFAYMVFIGLVVGGGTGLLVGLILAWHGAKVAAMPTSSAGAPVWGGFTGFVLGLFFGPAFGSVLGIFVGLPAAGAVLGLVGGPLLAILAWQAAYWLPK